MSKLIPNAFMTPNVLVDKYMRFLTGDEYKILSIFMRRRYGSQAVKWQRVSEGDAARLAGIGMGTASKCIDSLMAFGLLILAEEADYTAGKPRLFDVQTDAGAVKEDLMQARANAKTEKNKQRISAARASNPKVSVPCPTDTASFPVPQIPDVPCPTGDKKRQDEKTNEITAAFAAGTNPETPFEGEELRIAGIEDETTAAKMGIVAHVFYRHTRNGKSQAEKEIANRVKNQAHRDACLIFAKLYPGAQFNFGTWIGQKGSNIERFISSYADDERVIAEAVKLNRDAARENPMFAARTPVMLVPYLDAARIKLTPEPAQGMISVGDGIRIQQL